MPTNASDPSAADAQDPLRVLIVDDDRGFRLVATTILRRDGRFDIVGEATDGASCLEMTAEVRPDAVLLDLLMPGMDGFEVFPLLREQHPDVFVVVLTALDEREVQGEFVLHGVDAFLEKRYVTERLVELLLQARQPGDPSTIRT